MIDVLNNMRKGVRFNMNKYIDTKENIEKFKDIFKEKGLERCLDQLSDRKKVSNGFNIDESVIDVIQGGYAISRDDDILFTAGVGPCCAIVAFDGEKRMLFHIDGTSKPEDVKKKMLDFNMKENSTILVIPGGSCGIPGSFLYEKLEEELKLLGYNVQERRIPADLGFVTVDLEQITIGTAFDRSLDTTFKIKDTQHIVKESLEHINLGELENIKKAMIKQNEIIKSEGRENG